MQTDILVFLTYYVIGLTKSFPDTLNMFVLALKHSLFVINNGVRLLNWWKESSITKLWGPDWGGHRFCFWTSKCHFLKCIYLHRGRNLRNTPEWMPLELNWNNLNQGPSFVPLCYFHDVTFHPSPLLNCNIYLETKTVFCWIRFKCMTLMFLYGKMKTIGLHGFHTLYLLVPRCVQGPGAATSSSYSRNNRAFCRNKNILNKTSRDKNRTCCFRFQSEDCRLSPVWSSDTKNHISVS